MVIELIEMFPERIGTAEMHKAGIRLGKTAPAWLYEKLEEQLSGNYNLPDIENPRLAKVEKWEKLLQLCKETALSRNKDTGEYRHYAPSMEDFLIDLCINPRVSFTLPGEKSNWSQFESARAMDEYRQLNNSDFKPASLEYFQDIMGALLEYKRRHENQIRESFCLTTIGKKIWATLDFALASDSMVVLDGLEGRGKTEAVKAWCEAHLGQARFVSLKGIANKTTAFREISKALGIASSYARTSTDMQARIEDVLKRSGLLLVIDEAHFLFSQGWRIHTRPELIDWIDTAICNQGIGCALVTTPQFLVCMTRAADQVEWNFKQFRRRVSRWVKLPDKNTEADIHAVARSIFKKAPEAAIKKIVGYALLSKRDVSAVGDVARELRVVCGKENLSDVTTEQVHNAIYDFLLPSDTEFLDGMVTSRSRTKKPRKLVAPMPEISDAEKDHEARDTGASYTGRVETFDAPQRQNEPVLTAH